MVFWSVGRSVSLDGRSVGGLAHSLMIRLQWLAFGRLSLCKDVQMVEWMVKEVVKLCDIWMKQQLICYISVSLGPQVFLKALGTQGPAASICEAARWRSPSTRSRPEKMVTLSEPKGVKAKPSQEYSNRQGRRSIGCNFHHVFIVFARVSWIPSLRMREETQSTSKAPTDSMRQRLKFRFGWMRVWTSNSAPTRHGGTMRHSGSLCRAWAQLGIWNCCGVPMGDPNMSKQST